MATALVLGSNGQDGILLCRHLLRRGYRVTGVGRQTTPRIDHSSPEFAYVSVDLAGPRSGLSDLLSEVRPSRVFHVAAVHASAEHATYEPVFGEMLDVNVGSVHCVLEYLRTKDRSARLIYASSAKVFGAPLPERIDEETRQVATCLYSVTKIAAGEVIRHYRRAHGCLASQVYLFNHESEFRPSHFFLPKVTRCLAAALRGEGVRESVDTMQFYCDWGSAEEYMSLVIDACERVPGEDFVLATGRSVYAQEFVETMFARRGLRASDHIVEGRSESEPRQARYEVSTGKIQRMLGSGPRTSAEEVADWLVVAQALRE